MTDAARKLTDAENDAVKDLVERWKSDPRTLESFKKRYGKDHLSAMFGTATNMVKRGWRDGQAAQVLARLKSWDFIGTKEDFEPVADDGGDVNRGWRQKDLQLLEKRNLDVRKMLSKSPFDFSLYFVLDKEVNAVMRKWGPSEAPLREEHKRGIREDLSSLGGGHDLPEDRSAINVVLTGMGNTFGKEDNLPPTPWIVVHWIAHGVMKTKGGGNFLEADRYDTYNKAWEILADAYADAAVGVDRRDVKSPFVFVPGWKSYKKEMLGFMHRALTFRAARKGLGRDPWELLHDLLAQYIVKGRVKTNAELGGSFQWNSAGRKRFESRMEDLFDMALKSAKGKTFVV